jgi:hypothetical protein
MRFFAESDHDKQQSFHARRRDLSPSGPHSFALNVFVNGEEMLGL